MTQAEQDDFRATTEELIADAERLKAIEQRKLEVGPISPAAHDLSSEAEEVARRIAVNAQLEKQLAENLSPSS